MRSFIDNILDLLFSPAPSLPVRGSETNGGLTGDYGHILTVVTVGLTLEHSHYLDVEGASARHRFYVEQTDSNHGVELYQCFWDTLAIAGSGSSMSGAWQVNAYWNNAPLFSAPFTISSTNTAALIWQKDTTRQVTTNYYNGATLTGWNWLNSSGSPGWTVVAAADFDGNGVPDLVWQNCVTRQVTVNYYGGTGGATPLGWHWLNSSGIAGWTVVGASDFDGNGAPDLVWQDDATAQVTVNYYGGSGGATLQGWNMGGNSVGIGPITSRDRLQAAYSATAINIPTVLGSALTLSYSWCDENFRYDTAHQRARGRDRHGYGLTDHQIPGGRISTGALYLARVEVRRFTSAASAAYTWREPFIELSCFRCSRSDIRSVANAGLPLLLRLPDIQPRRRS